MRGTSELFPQSFIFFFKYIIFGWTHSLGKIVVLKTCSSFWPNQKLLFAGRKALDFCSVYIHLERKYLDASQVPKHRGAWMAAGDDEILWALSSATCPKEQLSCAAAPKEAVQLHHHSFCWHYIYYIFYIYFAGICQTGAAL